MSTIHERIRTRREQLGLSQEALAKELGVKYQTVQHWEREPADGVKSAAPKRTRLAEVARVLKVSPEYLMTGRDGEGNLVDPSKVQLLEFYDGLPPELQDALVQHANALFNAAGGDRRGAANPFPAKPKGSR